MGLFGDVFGRVCNAVAKTASGGQWQADGRGVLDGGTCGGDIQAGNSYAVRFIRPDLPGSMITVTFYPVADCPPGFVVERQVEWLVCEDPADPGGTEVWSRYAYDRPYGTVFPHPDQAQDDAYEAATQTLDLASVYGRWDGQPDWERTM
jgi:hypothetical protein